MALKSHFTQTITAFLSFFILFALNCPVIDAAITKTSQTDIIKKVCSVQVPFIKNEGQIQDINTLYHAKTLDGSVLVSRDGRIVYCLPVFRNTSSGISNTGYAIEEHFPDTRNFDVKGVERLTTRLNYIKGAEPSGWSTGITAYNRVSMGNVADGIELSLKAYGTNVEKLFHVKPDADPALIHVTIKGADSLTVNEQGELEIQTAHGIVKFTKPCAYQEDNGSRKFIRAAYSVKGNSYGFILGDYDRQKELVIDPLLASTFLGGSSIDRAYCVSIGPDDSVYVAGYTFSPDFPTTSGTIQYGEDAFVSKFDSSLEQMLSSTTIGGSGGGDRVQCMALDSNGNVYVAGRTSAWNFPTTAGALDTAISGSEDAFVAKFDNSLEQMLASTFIGGSRSDSANSISIDSSGNVYVTGRTGSSDFPTTSEAFDKILDGSNDAFLTRLDSNLTQLLASTLIGGNDSDWSYCLSIDPHGNLFIAGETYSSDFPVTASAYDTTQNGTADAFIAKFDDNLGMLLAATLLGGGAKDWANCIATDTNGNLYAGGETHSSDFPISTDAYDTCYNGAGDAFLSRFDGNLEQLVSCTYLGGAEYDIANFLALDHSNHVYIAGHTASSDFPVTPGACSKVYEGAGEGFVTILNRNLGKILSSAFLGGCRWDNPYCIAIDLKDRDQMNIYVAGGTTSTDFPAAADSRVIMSAADSSASDTESSGESFVTRYVMVTGDVDNSLEVDLTDAILVLQVMAGNTSSQVNMEADVSGNGKLGFENVIYILQKVSGLR